MRSDLDARLEFEIIYLEKDVQKSLIVEGGEEIQSAEQYCTQPLRPLSVNQKLQTNQNIATTLRQMPPKHKPQRISPDVDTTNKLL